MLLNTLCLPFRMEARKREAQNPRTILDLYWRYVNLFCCISHSGRGRGIFLITTVTVNIDITSVYTKPLSR